MGAGLYVVWPAFYTDVTDAYRLGKGGRLRTDFGGIYFNAVFILAMFVAYLFTHFEPLLAVIFFQHIEMAHQFMPFLRLDGYYMVADLTGVPDLFSRIKPVLQSLTPLRKPDPLVGELKGWVRVAVTLWVLATVPAIMWIYGVLLANMPKFVATMLDSGGKLLRDAANQVGHGNAALAAIDAVQVLLLALPVVGILLSFLGIGRRILAGTWHATSAHPARRVGLVAASAVLAMVALFIVSPRQRYQPIAPTDRGTFQSLSETLVAPSAQDAAPAVSGPEAPPAAGQPANAAASGATPAPARAGKQPPPNPAAASPPASAASPAASPASQPSASPSPVPSP
jgi:putative peptide zinc metalloprotease protein